MSEGDEIRWTGGGGMTGESENTRKMREMGRRQMKNKKAICSVCGPGRATPSVIQQDVNEKVGVEG